METRMGGDSKRDGGRGDGREGEEKRKGEHGTRKGGRITQGSFLFPEQLGTLGGGGGKHKCAGR